MRVNKKVDYGEISKRSIRKDIIRDRVRPNYTKKEIDITPNINYEYRVAYISDNSGYARYARYIINKLVRIKSQSNITANSWYCEFVHDDDRRALNMAAGWSDNKREYLFDGIKFKNQKDGKICM